jgi:hypothetical protein
LALWVPGGERDTRATLLESVVPVAALLTSPRYSVYERIVLNSWVSVRYTTKEKIVELQENLKTPRRKCH